MLDEGHRIRNPDAEVRRHGGPRPGPGYVTWMRLV